jgi:hypothetical protein
MLIFHIHSFCTGFLFAGSMRWYAVPFPFLYIVKVLLSQVNCVCVGVFFCKVSHIEPVGIILKSDFMKTAASSKTEGGYTHKH